MESHQEILKAKIINAKIELEKKTYNYVSTDVLTDIELNYACKINKIIYKGEIVESDLIIEINKAIDSVKIQMTSEYTAMLTSMGIKL